MGVAAKKLTTETKLAPRNRPVAFNPSLEGLRAFAIALVMFHHYTYLSPTTAAQRALVNVSLTGWMGVDLFFALSGFLITGILLETKDSRFYFKNFYARRSLRIFPLHYAFLAACAAGAYASPLFNSFLGAPLKDPAYWTYLSNFSVAQAGSFPQSSLKACWSLAVEEQFYLLWPFVVFALSEKKLLSFALATMLAALFFRVGMTLQGASPTAIKVLLFTRMDALAAGAVAALLFRKKIRFPAVTSAAVSLGAATLIFLIEGPHWENPWVGTLGYSFLAMGFASLILFVAHHPKSWLAHPALRRIGRYSYGMYIFHLTAPLLFAPWARGHSQLQYYAYASLCTFVVSAISYHAFEKYFLKLKSRFDV